MTRQKRLSLWGVIVTGVVLAMPARANDIRLGFALGFGGAGITSVESVAGDEGSTEKVVNRAQKPGVVAVHADYLLRRDIVASLEHSRGFTLGPFSSTVSFTGLAGRYYFFGGAPVDARKNDAVAIIRIRKFSFFAGGGFGIAKGTIVDTRDVVPVVSASGVYVGARNGFEYLLNPQIGLRPEISYSMTLFSKKSHPQRVKEFSAQMGLFFFL